MVIEVPADALYTEGMCVLRIHLDYTRIVNIVEFVGLSNGKVVDWREAISDVESC